MLLLCPCFQENSKYNIIQFEVLLDQIMRTALKNFAEKIKGFRTGKQQSKKKKESLFGFCYFLYLQWYSIIIAVNITGFHMFSLSAENQELLLLGNFSVRSASSGYLNNQGLFKAKGKDNYIPYKPFITEHSVTSKMCSAY